MLVWVFWEGHKTWKYLRRTFDKSVVFCARNSVLFKKSTKIFQNKCGQVVLYKLYLIRIINIDSRPFTDSGPWSESNWWPDLNVKPTMADDEVNQADIDDILNSPSKPPSKPSSKPSSKPPTPPSNNGGSNSGSKPTSPPTPAKVANYEPLPGKWVNFCVQKTKNLGLFWFWKKN